jgi:protein JSN1
MAPSTPINLNYIPQLAAQPLHSGSSTATTSPVEPQSAASLRFPSNTSNPLAPATQGARLSPSHDYGGRLFSKRFVAP